MAEEQINICLLWGDWQIHQWWSCMNRTEWAAWFQFFGVFIAVFGSCIAALLQLHLQRKEKVKDLENDFNDSFERIKCVLQDELDYISGNLQKYNKYYMEDTNQPKPYGFYIFTPRELNPLLIKETLEKYYLRFNSNQRLAFKAILKLVSALNYQAENAKISRLKKDNRGEISFIDAYMKTGCVYRYLLLKFLASEDVPESAVNDSLHIKEMANELNLSLRFDYM